MTSGCDAQLQNARHARPAGRVPRAAVRPWSRMNGLPQVHGSIGNIGTACCCIIAAYWQAPVRSS